MDKANLYRNGIPKDLPNRSKDSHWIGEVDEKEAEESLSLYCKPVELYNIIQQRCEQQPLFLQRCLSYKIQAAWQRRIRMTLSVTGYTMGKVKGKDPRTRIGLVEHTVFVMVTSPVAFPAEGQVVYRLRESRVVYRLGQSQVLAVGESDFSSPDDGSEVGVTFILPELRKLLQNAKNGDVILFVICESAEIYAENGGQVGTLANCCGRIMWGKLAISSLCMNWLMNTKESAPRSVSDRGGVETRSQVDLRPGNLQHQDSPAGKTIKLSTMAKTTAERSLVQLQVRVFGGEVGQIIPKGKITNGTVPRSTLPYSLSHAWSRPRVGRVVFHYLYYHGMLRKTEVTEEFSCPFCLNGCASFKGLRRHLNASHDLFNFEFVVSGDLQVVNVTCHPDLDEYQGNLRHIDGLSDPRVKNFSYWFRRSRFRRRKLPVSSGEHLLDVDNRAQQTVEIEGRSQVGGNQGKLGIPDLHQVEDPNDTYVDDTVAVAGNANASEQDLEGDPSVADANGEACNGTNATMSSRVIDVSRKKEAKHGDTSSSQHEQKIRTAKLHDTDSLRRALKQRITPSQKRQRMKGVLGERALARSRPSPSFGGACASAGGAQDLDDSVMQHTSSAANKVAMDRHDIHRTRALLQKRQYFHSHTAQPMDADQLFGDRDSEDEVDNAITDLEDRRLLDDFVDVTPEEKEVMHLWNSFARRNHVIADGHCPWACQEFSKENAKRFGESPALRRCLMLFLVKLWNHHLVDGETINHCLTIVDSFEHKNEGEQK